MLTNYQNVIHELSGRIVSAQKPIRILDALKWDAQIQAGFFKHKPTGYFGPITKRALARFQKAHHLMPNGVVGPETWQFLSRYL